MATRFWLVILALGSLSLDAGRASAQDAASPDLKPLLAPIRKLVEKHYPKAQVVLKGQTIRFEFNTRKFMIHEANREGIWGDAGETTGPQLGGISGYLNLQRGAYGGPLHLPQEFDKRYFTHYYGAPYSKKLDRRLDVQLNYPANVSKEFLKEFRRLTDEFEAHIVRP